MKTSHEVEAPRVSKASLSETSRAVSRRSFFTGAAALGATAIVAGTGLVTKASAQSAGPTSGDVDILIAAEIAEALAVTTYHHIIRTAPFFSRLPDDDQNYIKGALQEEMSHYALEQSATGQDSPFDEFFYPKHMFQSAQVTLNTLTALEDAFIAAYLVGVRNFSTPDLRVTAARIMGIESDHRTLARVLAGEVLPKFGGPIENVTGLAGVPESIDPPNNNTYERTACWTDISQALTALTPFVDIATAQKAGFDVSRSFAFDPTSVKIPNKLGDFISFKGC